MVTIKQQIGECKIEVVAPTVEEATRVLVRIGKRDEIDIEIVAVLKEMAGAIEDLKKRDAGMMLV